MIVEKARDSRRLCRAGGLVKRHEAADLVGPAAEMPIDFELFQIE